MLAYSACPRCQRDLYPNEEGSKRPYFVCPYCFAPLTIAWWQRLLIPAVAFFLLTILAIFLNLGWFISIFVWALFGWPALMLAVQIVCGSIRPRYVFRYLAVQTLFDK